MGTPPDLNGLEEIVIIVVFQSWFNTIMIYLGCEGKRKKFCVSITPRLSQQRHMITSTVLIAPC